MRFQQSTARSSIAPAVLSLVLVALALLMRLLNAASELRVPELALASLRGVTARRLWGLGLAEPVGTAPDRDARSASASASACPSCSSAAGWCPGCRCRCRAASWVAGGLVLVAAFAVACVAVGLVVRESLASQLSGVRRPVAARRWSVIAQLTLVALAVATLASKLSASGPGEPDATDLVLPVLLAVVAGLAATRLTAVLATWWTGRSRGRSLSGFVSSRAISRRQEGTLVILPITAAIAVAVFGAGVYDSAATWRTSVAATVSPADTTWSTTLTLSEAVDLTRRIDPDGEWIMAAASATNPGANFSIVDSSRLARVADLALDLEPGPRRRPGRRRDHARRRGADRAGQAALDHDRQPGRHGPRPRGRGPVRQPRRAPLKAYVGPFPEGEHTRSTKVPFCRDGCPLEGMTLGGGAGTNTRMSGTLRLVGIEVDGAPVEGGIEGAGWTPTPDPAVRSSITEMEESGGAARPTVDTGDSVGMARLTAGGITRDRPALSGPGVQDRAIAKLDEGYGLIPVDRVGEIEGMPFTGPSGLLVDYSSFITDRPVYDNLMTVRVLAREARRPRSPRRCRRPG